MSTKMEQYINQIINADCLDILRELPDKSIDLVLTDPPYRDNKDNQPTIDMRNNGTMKDFGNKPTKEVFDEIFISLNKEGRDAKWFYFSLSNLGNCNIAQCRNLFSY